MNNVLDLGSGDGFFANTLSKNKKNKVYGIDLSSEAIAISKKRYQRVIFQIMNSEKMKFRDNFFDEIYAMDVLEHVDSLDKVLNEVRRVLKKDGKFFINIPYHKSEKWLLKVRPNYHKEIHHVRIFKETELEAVLREKSFKLVSKKKTGFLQHVELFILFKRKNKSSKQTSIGSWRDNYFTKTVHATMLYFDPTVLHTPLVYVPVWLLTLPIGKAINTLGNNFLPKSQHYEFIKI